MMDFIDLKKQQELIRAKDLEHINRETEDKIMASYVEREPILMKDPELEKMYHYDEYSKSLRRLPKDSELHKVTPEQIEKILQDPAFQTQLAIKENPDICVCCGKQKEEYIEALRKDIEDEKKIKNKNKRKFDS